MKTFIAIAALLMVGGCASHAESARTQAILFLPAYLVMKPFMRAEPADELVAAVKKGDVVLLDKLLTEHPEWMVRRGSVAFQTAKIRRDARCQEILLKHGQIP